MIEGLVQHDTEMRNADDRRALTPLFHGHINPYGQFAIDLAQPSFFGRRLTGRTIARWDGGAYCAPSQRPFCRPI
jgi:hypothetical protein